MTTPSYNYTLDNIPSSGYTVIDAQLDDEHYDSIKTKCMQHDEKEFNPIFASFDDDHKPILTTQRMQSLTIIKGTSNDKSWKHLRYKIENQIKFIHRAPTSKKIFKMKHFALLLSKNPCPQQVEHNDFVPQDVPLYSGIFSFDDNTKLTVFGKGGSSKDVRVPAGFFILFTADCKHAGSEYVGTENRRLFFKAMPSSFVLPKTEGSSVNNVPFPCPYCPNGGKHTLRQLKRHIENSCLTAPAEVLAKRMETKRKKSEENAKSYLNRKAKENK